MSLLGYLVSIGLGIAVIAPVMQSSALLVRKQTQLENAWLVEHDALRVLEIMARAIRMAGYRKISSLADYPQRTTNIDYIGLEQRSGWNHSDLLWVKQESADSAEGDCLGNRVEPVHHGKSQSRTKKGLRYQGFFVQKAVGDHAGSLMCSSLDRQGRLQNDQGKKIRILPDLSRKRCQGQGLRTELLHLPGQRPGPEGHQHFPGPDANGHHLPFLQRRRQRRHQQMRQL